jgi:hypothetical protein
MSQVLDAATVQSLVDEFFVCIGRGEVEIYNEFSLQHEIGIHLRNALGSRCKVQFERPTTYFDIPGMAEKREIDIALFSEDRSILAAVELKFPRNGQYPEQMFSACVDLAFLEDLVRSGFGFGLFVIAADDALFFRGAADRMPYSAFRAGSPLTGEICKPTGKKDRVVRLAGEYAVRWRSIDGLRHAVVTVDRESANRGGTQ